MSKRSPSISFKPSGFNKPCTTIINGDLKVKGNLNAKIQIPKDPQTIKSGFRAYDTGSQITGGSETANFNTVSFDIGNDYDISTNQFTAPSDGYYQINSSVYLDKIDISNGLDFPVSLSIVVNGVDIISTGGILYPGGVINQVIHLNISAFTSLNANDTVEIQVNNPELVNPIEISGTHFSIAQIGI